MEKKKVVKRVKRTLSEEAQVFIDKMEQRAKARGNAEANTVREAIMARLAQWPYLRVVLVMLVTGVFAHAMHAQECAVDSLSVVDMLPLGVGDPSLDVVKVLMLVGGLWEIVARQLPTNKDYTVVSRVLGWLGRIIPNRVKGDRKAVFNGGRKMVPVEDVQSRK